jgi:hypothetical protein
MRVKALFEQTLFETTLFKKWNGCEDDHSS